MKRKSELKLTSWSKICFSRSKDLISSVKARGCLGQRRTISRELGRRLARQVELMFRLMAGIVLVHQGRSQTPLGIDMARIILEIDLVPIIPETGLAITQDPAVELAPLVAITEVRVDLASKAANSTTTIILLRIGDPEIRLQESVLAQLDLVALREAEEVRTDHLLRSQCRIKTGWGATP